MSESCSKEFRKIKDILLSKSNLYTSLISSFMVEDKGSMEEAFKTNRKMREKRIIKLYDNFEGPINDLMIFMLINYNWDTTPSALI